MSLKEKEIVGVAGKVIGGHFHSRIVITSGKSKKYNIVSLDPLYVDRFGNVFFRTPNKFMKAEITYYTETDSIEDLLIDLKNAGYEIIWFRTSSGTFTRNILSTFDFQILA
jgi:hypothetical protein